MVAIERKSLLAKHDRSTIQPKRILIEYVKFCCSDELVERVKCLKNL